MPQKENNNNINELEKISELERQLYMSLGQKFFFFIAPYSSDPDFADQLKKLDKNLAKISKKQDKLQQINFYINSVMKFQAQQKVPPPAILEEEKANISPLTYNFIYSLHKAQQARWMEALPDFAMYSLEFFVPPLTEEELGLLSITDRKEEKLNKTIIIDMPFALQMDEQGFFDIDATILHEQKYHLIKSKLASITKGEIAANYLAQKLINFSNWQLFAINHQDELKEIAQLLVQAVFDNMMAFAYTQIGKGLPANEALKNAYAFMKDFAIGKKLPSLLVFRAYEEMPLDLYLLEILGELKGSSKYIGEQILRDLYSHAMKSMSELIIEDKIPIGTLFKINIRESTDSERERTLSPVTVEIILIDEEGRLMDKVKEYYLVRISDSSAEDLTFASTLGLEMQNYFI